MLNGEPKHEAQVHLFYHPPSAQSSSPSVMAVERRDGRTAMSSGEGSRSIIMLLSMTQFPESSRQSETDGPTCPTNSWTWVMDGDGVGEKGRQYLWTLCSREGTHYPVPPSHQATQIETGKQTQDVRPD